MTDAAERLRLAFAEGLRADGAIVSEPWYSAFAQVPRETFVPRFFLHNAGGGMRAVADGDAEWLSSVYSDLTLVTQLDGDDSRWDIARRNGTVTGAPTSSSTQPALMAWMLEALAVTGDDRVLEIGTGTGYNAALLAHRLGAGSVVSVDVDAEVVTRARQALRTCGYRAAVHVADGASGYSADAPYDHVLATCSWPRIPAAWCAQVRPGGRLLSHLHTAFDAGAMVLLTVQDAHRAEGRFLPWYGSFMPTRRHQRPDTLAMLRTALRSGEPGRSGPLTLPPGELLSDGFSLFAGLRVPDVATHWFQPEGAPAMQTWLLGRDGSWAHDEFDGAEVRVVQAGPRRLWDELASCHRDWDSLGSPERSRFGLTVVNGQHVVWLDDPGDEWRWEPA